MPQRTLVVLAIAGLFVVVNFICFTVEETGQALVLRFGKPVNTVTTPGLHFKLPFPIEQVVYFEDRLLEYDSSPTQILTKDKKALQVDNYARWRIADVLLFRQAVHDENGAQARLDDIIFSELRVELGRFELHEIIGPQREQIMAEVTQRCSEKAKEYGIEIADVRIKRADLPEENENAVYERMRAERTREANQYRSEGEEEALKIRAETDKQRLLILAEAYRIAETNRGKGDAEALTIYADAFERDPRFYRFTRTLEAYKKTLSTNTSIVLSPDAEFFQLLERSKE